MTERSIAMRLAVVGVLVAFTNLACYNQYFISKSELEKLEATVEQKAAVAVIVDGCDIGKKKTAEKAEVVGPADPLANALVVAQDDGTATDADPAPEADAEEDATADEGGEDAVAEESDEGAEGVEDTAEESVEAKTESAPANAGSAAKQPEEFPEIDPETGCPLEVVNTASPLNVVTKAGERYRVTPFNFAVTESQVVSPDYDLLLPISEVEGAEVQTFSGWKTGLLITGVVAVSVGLFVGIKVTAGEERGLGQQ